ncbi:MAG: hypothetical protein N2645_02495 [Clostridia bacterium]|nr:hypothetical protein [Clostridia bacterium]
MLYTGKKVRFSDRDVVILAFAGDEVLIFLEKGTKWVNRTLLEIPLEDAALQLAEN